MMKKAAFSPPSRPWLLSVSYLKSPKPQCLSAFRPLKIRVTTESERSQNGVRTEAEQRQNLRRTDRRALVAVSESRSGVLLDFDDVKLRRNRAPCKSSFPFASACVILHFPCFFSACCSGLCPCAAPLSYVLEIGRVKPGRRGSSTIR